MSFGLVEYLMEVFGMPRIGRGGEFVLRLFNCREWRELSDLISALEVVQNMTNIVTLEPYLIERNGQKGRVPIADLDFRSYCESTYQFNINWDNKNYYAALPQGKLWLRFRPPFINPSKKFVGLADDLSINMVCNKFGDEYNELQFQLSLSPRTVPSSTLTEDFGDTIIELYTEIGKQLIILLAPDYLWIAEDDEYEEHLGASDILARRLEVIYWANYFGSGYLDKDKEKSFWESPVGIVNSVNEGIWYQLHKRFDNIPLEIVKSIESQVLTHFSHFGLDRVQWKYKSG